ncbi:MAG: sulfate adenylyltransferase, partial [Halobacteria archaeon]|nr:sulfate adenylyltransferase [Halobacteria archaeon]
QLEPGKKAGLESPDGELIGYIQVDEVYKYNSEETARHVFGTADKSHPGVQNYFEMNEFLVGGDIKVFDEYRYSSEDLLPKESRVLFKHLGWDTVVGFQTRNAPHRAHEYIQKSALEHTDGLLIQPKLGEKKSGDYRDSIIIG